MELNHHTKFDSSTYVCDVVGITDFGCFLIGDNVLVEGTYRPPQAVLDYFVDRLTPADLGKQVYDDLLAYATAGAAWTGSDAQLQAKSSGLTHLIVGSPEYQFV